MAGAHAHCARCSGELVDLVTVYFLTCSSVDHTLVCVQVHVPFLQNTGDIMCYIYDNNILEEVQVLKYKYKHFLDTR